VLLGVHHRDVKQFCALALQDDDDRRVLGGEQMDAGPVPDRGHANPLDHA
jgi:hypothetical protein